ncbi:MAG: NAD(P)/FAD-dependent oxidoreductase [Verrucomicrobiota bacterium]
MEELSFDVIVVGSGTSAYYCATTLNKAGKRVAIVDQRPYGGTCALRGCQPKKYLVANADAVAMAQHLVGNGIQEAPRTDWAALQALKNEFLKGHSEEAQEDFEKSGIKTFFAKAVMTGPQMITAGDVTLTADYIVLATGSEPRRATFPGSQYMGTSEDFLSMETLPKRILFIGGGYISFEFATVAAHAGSKATIVHRSAQVLKNFDQDCVQILLQAVKHAGIEMATHTSPERIEKLESGYRVSCSDGAVLEADVIIEATGRVPNLSVVKEEGHNVDYSNRGIAVNSFLQSVSNPNVYAIGDVAASGFQLAPVADKQGLIAAKNILEGNRHEIDYEVVPSAVFTIPNLATVGMDEAAAEKAGLEFRANQGSTKDWPSSKRIGEKYSFYKVLIEKGSERILGAHLVRHNASEVINTFALAMKHGLTATDLGDVMWAYPTYTSDLKYMVR